MSDSEEESSTPIDIEEKENQNLSRGAGKPIKTETKLPSKTLSKNLFCIKMKQGFVIKEIVNYLKSFKEEEIFYLTREGIYIKVNDGDSEEDSVVENLGIIKIRRDCVLKYSLDTGEEKSFIATNLNISTFYEMIRSLRKKDELSMVIERDKPSTFLVSFCPPGGKATNKKLTILKSNKVSVSEPTDYDEKKEVSIEAKEFVNKIKDMGKKEKYIQITRRGNNCLKFYCEYNGEICSQEAFFSNEDEEEFDENSPIDFDFKFNPTNFRKIMKLAAISTVVRICPGNKILRLTMNPGSISKVVNHIKSIEYLEEIEKTRRENSEDEDEPVKKIEKKVVKEKVTKEKAKKGRKSTKSSRSKDEEEGEEE